MALPEARVRAVHLKSCAAPEKRAAQGNKRPVFDLSIKNIVT